MKNFEIKSHASRLEPHSLPSLEDGYEAFVRVKPEMDALPDKELLHITVDIPRACGRALWALPKMLAMVPQIEEELPKHPVDKLKKLEDYANAALYAHHLVQPLP